ncbi:diaminopimelate decarboxylase family protein [Microseira wollei]|uniref:Orn/DAP/Arg decarboxylase 2 n=1 Tax=Microseira wollei NIES-4236 TaxID=2530354 RepID=A0AAV3X8W6_9CYAN|nr:decarboxylase [Microseira wollei]GET38613.1 Orn/DAP/Arg decarboxylase 2 [Microseira wollei NIES-4236]
MGELISLEIAEELLEKYGSPLYVYESDRLHQTIDRITQSIPYPRTQFHFASVTNGNIALMQIFHACGWKLHANTPGDIYLGLKAGYSPAEIVYSGSNLNAAEMRLLLTGGVRTLNLDSLSQLSLCCEIYQELRTSIAAPKLGLRLNLPEITGESRIGVHPDEFEDAIAIANSAKIKLSGLHFYRGTGTNATEAFTSVIETVVAAGKLLPDWEYLDFGGGFGYPYNKNIAGFNWSEFGAELTQQLLKIGKEIELIIEPGRAAIAGCATLLSQVVSVKWQGEKQIVGVDTTVANLSVPSVHGGYREIVAWKRLKLEEGGQDAHPTKLLEEGGQDAHPTRGQLHLEKGGQDAHPTRVGLHPTDVCGNTTYSRDYLGRNCQLPRLQMGDIIAILDVGAYGYAMSSHFLHRPRPAEVLLENGKHRLIRRREDYSILLENQVF